MTLFDGLVLGIVEGISEFLPISSTAHVIVASSLLGIIQSDFVKSFEIIIQLGAILAVVVLYWRSFLNVEMIKKIVVAFIPTGIIGLALYSIVKTYLIGNVAVALWMLGIGGIALVVFEWWYGRRVDKSHEHTNEITYKQALVVGLAQSVAIVPGVSRSAATIVGGLLMGINRQTIVEFSFLLAVPTMAAATGLDLLKNYHVFSSANIEVLVVGFVTSFVVALVSITWLLGYVRTHDFTAFGIYRIAAAAVFWFMLMM